ncbi:MAG TPA: hypothetical protein VII63_10030 [Caulobacteraceae bacterium]
MGLGLKFAGPIAAFAAVFLLALVAWPRTAAATPLFKQQTGLPCSACHNSGQELQGEQGLNPVGRAFEACGEKLGCDDKGSFSRPAPVRHTTENFNGVANFTGKCSGQTRWVALRPGRNAANRDLALILSPGDHVKVAVSQGSTFAARCGSAPDNDQQFQYINLEEWVAP